MMLMVTMLPKISLVDHLRLCLGRSTSHDLEIVVPSEVQDAVDGEEDREI